MDKEFASAKTSLDKYNLMRDETSFFYKHIKEDNNEDEAEEIMDDIKESLDSLKPNDEDVLSTTKKTGIDILYQKWWDYSKSRDDKRLLLTDEVTKIKKELGGYLGITEENETEIEKTSLTFGQPIIEANIEDWNSDCE
jgi:hypothetical protein